MTNVRDYGAIGDGMVDDSNAIQHAVDQGDGHIFLPKGTYRLSKPIEFELHWHGPAAFTGEAGCTRLVMTGAGAAIRLLGTHDKNADPKNIRPDIWQRERMPTVSGIEIVGEHIQADGIELVGTMQATVSGVLIRQCRFGIHLAKRNRNFLLADSHIFNGRGAAIGVYFDAVNLHQAIIVGSHISYCAHAGIKIQRSEIRNLQITGCDIEYNFDVGLSDSADVWVDSREGSVREVTISSNTIQAKESPRGANVRIEGAELEASSSAGLWTIAGNILQSQAVNVLLRSCRGIAITGNSFASAFSRSIVIEKCRNIVVGSNTFDHNPDYDGDRVDGISIRNSAAITLSSLILEAPRSGTAEFGGAIEVQDSREVSIIGCQILEPTHRGIDIANVINSRVSDCTILDRRKPPTMREAIRLAGAGGGNMIHHNLVGKGTDGSLSIAEGTATVDANVTTDAPSR